MGHFEELFKRWHNKYSILGWFNLVMCMMDWSEERLKARILETVQRWRNGETRSLSVQVNATNSLYFSTKIGPPRNHSIRIEVCFICLLWAPEKSLGFLTALYSQGSHTSYEVPVISHCDFSRKIRQNLQGFLWPSLKAIQHHFYHIQLVTSESQG